MGLSVDSIFWKLKGLYHKILSEQSVPYCSLVHAQDLLQAKKGAWSKKELGELYSVLSQTVIPCLRKYFKTDSNCDYCKQMLVGAPNCLYSQSKSQVAFWAT